MRVISRVGMAVVLTACLGGTASAQVTSTTSTETKQFEVIAVDGREIVVRTAEGTRQLTVPDDFRFSIDGKPVSVQELKPGMIGMATITTRTTMTPVTVTEVKNGTVAQVSPSSIAVRTDAGIRVFTQNDVDQRGVKILRDGKPAQLADFSPGDYLTATIVTTRPPLTMTERDLEAVLQSAPQAPPPPIAASAPAAPPLAPTAAPASQASQPVATTGVDNQAAPAAPAVLPNTASPLPLIGVAGLAALALGAVLTTRRLRRS